MNEYLDNIYKLAMKHTSETEVGRLVEKSLQQIKGFSIPAKYPVKQYLYLTEAFDPLQLTRERRIANDIYRDLLKDIYSKLSRNEKDMIGAYKTYGSVASLPYDIDEFRKTSLYSSLDNNHSFSIDTVFGKLIVKFSERNEYKMPEDVLLGYDDETKTLIIFVENIENITKLDIVKLFLDTDYNYLHELQHYVDDMTNGLVNKKYDILDSIAYLNDPDEFKANVQMIIGTFGRFILRNGKNLIFENLKDKNYINTWFDMFLGQVPLPKGYYNVIDADIQAMFRKDIFYLTPENKEEFYNQLYKYTSDYYNTEEDIKFDENKKKQELTRLFRLEENFM